MKLFKTNVFWGALLIVAGLLFLVESLGILALGSVWALVFAVAAFFFFMYYASNRANWWALIPGGTLAGVALTIGADAWLPASMSSWLTGSAVLICLGLSFLAINFVSNGEHWWALIPGGILTTLAVMVSLESGLPNFNDELFVGLMFLGFAATFAMVGTMKTRDGSMRWAFWPAGVMGIMGLIFSSFATNMINYVWPVVFIALGVVVLLRNVRSE